MAKKEKSFTLSLFNFVICILTVWAVLMTGVYVYYLLTENELYTTSTSTYVTAGITDQVTGEIYAPFEANYYANYNNTGAEVMEFKINAYSDYLKTTVYSRGLQLVTMNGNTELYFYDGWNGEYWESMHAYDETNDDGQLMSFYYIDIDTDGDSEADTVYAIRMDGSYTTTSFNSGKAFLTYMFAGLNLIFQGTDFYTTETHYYTFEEFLIQLKNMIKSCSYGTGDYTLPLIDLGDFWHVYEVSSSGVVSDEPLGSGGLINSYFSMDVHYSRLGMTYANQSLFGSVALDSSYNITGVDFDVNYWKSTLIYNITEQDFEARYSTSNGGYYYSLSTDLISELKNFNSLEIVIVFNISDLSEDNVLGFDYYALYGIEVSSLTITSDSAIEFTLLNGCLDETGLTQITINNVTLNNMSGVEVSV